MKTKASLSKSVKNSLQSAMAEANGILFHLKRLDEGEPAHEIMPSLRAELGILTQRVHEYNAYHNSLHTN